MAKKSEKYKKAGFEKSVKTYEVDYIILDTLDEKYKDMAFKFKSYSFLQLRTELNGFAIYKVE